MADHNRLYLTPQVSTSDLQHESNLTSFENFFIDRAHQAALHMHFNQAVAASLTLDWYMAFGPCPTLEQAEILRKMTAYECYAYTHGATMDNPDDGWRKAAAMYSKVPLCQPAIEVKRNLHVSKEKLIAILFSLLVWTVVMFCADAAWNVVKHLGGR